MTNRDVLIIEAGRTERHYWSDLWRYRELFYFLAWRDLLVRYKQTVIGVAWAALRPALTMVVFTIVFGRLAGLPSENVPYPIFVFAALLPWQLFATAFAESGNSLVGNANLISKVYFPRLVVPASNILVSLADFAVALAILAVLMGWYRFAPGWQVVTLPLFTLLAVAAAMSAGIWTAALNVKYRDVRFIIPFIVQMGLYVSPVGFSSSIIPPEWRLAYAINPMVGVIDGFRWSVSGGATPLHASSIVMSVVVIGFVLVTGVWYFRRTEKTFADII